MKAKSKELLKQIKNLSSEQVEYLKTSVSSTDNEHISSVAITGIAFNFPGNIRDLESFWELLKKGKHCIQDLNINARFNNHKKDINDKNYWGGFLEEGVEEFDPAFFQISPKEAEIMDPQHRLLLQAVWHALEDAAYLPERLSNSRTGVYIGVCTYDYADLISTQSLNSAHAALGKAPSLLANRVSYFFNWHGPSETIDTACSSSFVALHRAVEDLRRGECHQAIVGGANLLLSSRLFESFADAGMLSPNGHCRPLDAQANGYVRGEGVVAIVLKPLVEALRDKERIYGIIRGTAVNHGGKANSLTAPNPKAQANLLIEAYKNSNTPIETVSYIEMHGTGTPLGDPIEVEALQVAFPQLQTKEQLASKTCGLGSVKGNIGHLEAAAGLSGLIKVLACLRYQQLVPTARFQSLNPNIHLENSPLYIVNQLQEWPASQTEFDTLLPRRAGISSFGFGGANAHVIVEEGPEYVLSNEKNKPCYLITLSAKHPDSLKQRIEDLHDYLKKHPESPLEAIAYTLNKGRSHFDYRCALVVSSVDELLEKLEKVQENQQLNGFFKGDAKQKVDDQEIYERVLKSTLEELKTQSIEEISDYKKQLEALASLYVKGYDFDWNLLHHGEAHQKISLPTYPFLKERYWIPADETNRGVNRHSGSVHKRTGMNSYLNPLLHENTSNLAEQRFSSVFTGEEFFLRDHRVQTQKVLPGVAYVEMARAAVQHALGESEKDKSSIRLKNVAWASPIVVGETPQEVHISLFPEENGEITYEIYTQGDTEEDASVHSQGRATVGPLNSSSPLPSSTLGASEALPSLDLNTLQSRMNQSGSTEYTPEQCYEAFKAMGIEYGPGHQGIEKLLVGENEVLAKLSLPTCVLETRDQYILHPSLLDSALQASIGLMLGKEGVSPKLALPFALEELIVQTPCTDRMWAWLRRSEGGFSSQVQKLDIDLCDESGTICVQMKGFSSRVVEGHVSESASERIGTLMLKPVWKEAAASIDAGSVAYVDHRVVLYGFADMAPSLKEQMPETTFMTFESPKILLEKRFESGALQLFGDVQALLKEKPKGDILIQILIPEQGEEQAFSGLSGLLKTAHQENPRVLGQVISLSGNETAENIIKKLKENKQSPYDQTIRYQEGKRFISGWEEISVAEEEAKVPWKDQGVYLITGGAGGLGLLFAEEIAKKAKDVTLILTGRSELSEEKAEQIHTLRSGGARVEYKVVDVNDKKAVVKLIQNIRKEYGELNGVIHSAGVIRDNFLLNKTEEEFKEVLSPKVLGTLNLDAATRDMELDFFILFSSIAGGLGNVGQADYATANAFMNAYAEYRNQQVTLKERFGQTLSVQWPLWREGGMGVDEATENLMRTTMGMVPLQTQNGIQALYQGLSSHEPQLMVMEGLVNRIKQKLLLNSQKQKAKAALVTSSVISANVNSEAFEEKVTQYFKKILSSTLNLPVYRIEAQEPLEKYGIDSIMVMKMTNELEKTFGSLSKTLFFEYQTIEEVVHYFLEFHGEKLRELLCMEDNIETSTPERDTPKKILQTRQHRSRFLQRGVVPPSNGLDIAIIGLSGRYPQSRDLEDYWKNLESGRDCIIEVPKDRWDWRKYYTEDRTQAGGHYSKWGGFIEDVDKFDPLFFNISPREAEYMDPQERLFLEHVWMALEDAGYRREDLQGEAGDYLSRQVGVYAGVMYGEYQLFGAEMSLSGQRMALSSSYASIANRVSYALNLQGPSMAVDTMCSSSLTSLHLACQDLRQGRTDLGIAGGVNVSIHPNKYLMLSAGQFISSAGHCESFGAGGEGYIPGEGVGVAILKRLQDAEQAGDHIYGVIKGSAVNHGGKTNGYTVPNPNAQYKVINSALKEANIDSRTISYVEAHGTGTKLGDPIEIAGLTKAFGQRTQERQYCWIGSAKSNIGHCESAAGIAGVTKVLLQMQHGKVAPSLHSSTLNPNIDFTQTPFVVNQELRDWDRPVIEGKEYPRIAGISSFGAGGANAHVVIEEYISKRHQESQAETIPQASPVIIPLSAKTSERLQVYAQKLLTFIQKNLSKEEEGTTQLNLTDLAYTLQVGREAMEERLGLIVSSLKELEEKLQGFIEGKEGIEELYRGQVKRNKDNLAVFAADEDMAKTIEAWIEKRKYSKLLDLWVKGFILDWNKFYGEQKPHRMSLPTYPFAKERYWIGANDIGSGVTQHLGSNITQQRPGIKSYLHPLLQENTSNLAEQRFSSVFTGEEFFLRDHRVQTQKVLPGVAYLEMARAAVEHALGESEENKSSICLKNVVWASPIVVGENLQEVHISLFPEENGEITYEIYTQGDTEEDASVHSQGRATVGPLNSSSPLPSSTLGASEALPSLDLNTLQSRMNQSGSTEYTPEQCYEAFKAMGIEYGPGHQGIEKLLVGENEVLAKLSLPTCVLETRDQYILHPSLLDSALQASIGLMLGKEGVSPKLALPFALEELIVQTPCTDRMWAWLRRSEGGFSSQVQKLDIDLCDESGTICVQMKGFSSRVVEGHVSESASERIGTLMLKPVWKEAAASIDAGSVAYVDHRVVLYGFADMAPSLKEQMPETTFMTFESPKILLEKRFESGALQLFGDVQALLKEKPKGDILIQILIPEQGEEQAFSGLSGLLKTAHQENPRVLGQVISLSGNETAENIIKKLKENKQSPYDQTIRYQEGKRFISGWEEISVAEEEAKVPWKDQGVYLITGGAGGLGLLFAEEIAKKAKDVTLILTGRSELSEEKAEQIHTLRSGGARVEYKVVDVNDKKAVVKLIQNIRKEYGELNGVIHSAGVIRDNFLLNKTEEEFKEVLSPKVLGTLNLDAATRDMELDFFILFSSIAGGLGNVGQADYATANAFMNAYAEYRNQQVTLKERFGQTLSVQWPLWREGGMGVDEATENLMRTTMGMVPLQTQNGIQALYQGLSSHEPQLMVMEGLVNRIKQKLLLNSQKQKAKAALVTSSVISANVNSEAFEEKVTQYFKKILSSTLNLPVYRIEAQEPLEKYGIDSIMVMKMTNELEKTFGSLSKTLFFEYQTIEEVVHYFLEFHGEKLRELLCMEDNIETSTPERDTPKKILQTRQHRSRFLQRGVVPPSNGLDIAIIGLSGRYPQSRDLEDYWKNLESGRDCIIEVPKDRWDWRKYYTEDRTQAGGHYSKWGGFIEDVDKFDPLFFNISPREAEYMDPQERLFLEHVWMALEDAGYRREDLQGEAGDYLSRQVGVYAGVMYGEYQLFGAEMSLSGQRMALSSSYASIANRVSYALNLQGPSMAVDTMCSSSLTSLHLACQDLRQGRTDLGIAGGVNVSIHPNKYLMLSAGQFISSAGHCESFGAGGEGYIPGEGVGVAILKRLQDAEQAGDHIYGVIKGSAVNHGGKTNGYTVPNPNAQYKVINSALKEANIDSRTISYVEAHGTGTKLGDPIEIAGLTKAFGQRTQERQYCWIGSAKSNIGHCESAAGIAGVTKVLLQMQHGKVAPSLHSSTLNPNIDFTQTPFVVNQELRDWDRPVIEGKEYPRIAGISSFGAGGANAHVVIEEYISKRHQESQAETIPQASPVIIPLSAKTSERLQVYAQKLLTFIQKNLSKEEEGTPQLNLTDLAYTLQVGREAMEERLGLIVSSLKELEEKLQGFIEGKEGIEELYRGQVKRNKDNLAVFAADEDMAKTIEAWIEKRKYSKLLDLWVKGFILDWNKFYGEQKPHRMSLPTYPFAKERYWIGANDIGSGVTQHLGSNITQQRPGIKSYLHPLLQENTSNLAEQRFSSVFTGEEFFLRDHRVQTQKVLPGVAYLEMARAAVEHALGESEENKSSICLKNVVWASPIVVGENLQEVHISLFPEENGEITYEIYTQGDTEEDASVHSQGRATVGPLHSSSPLPSSTLGASEALPSLDLNTLQNRMSQSELTSEYTPEQCYEAFKAMGIEYGSAHQGIEKLLVGENEVLAKLTLPTCVLETRDQYILHPSLLDSALQASIGLMLGKEGVSPKLALPFALEELIVQTPCTDRMWAWLRRSEGGTSSQVQKLDIDLCDESGTICVQMKGFSSRIVEGNVSESASERIGTLMLKPVWKEAAASIDAGSVAYVDHRVVLYGFADMAPSLKEQLPETTFMNFESPKILLEKRFESAALQLFGEIQALLKEKPKGDILIQILIPEEGEDQVFSGLSGLLKTAHQENPRILGQVITLSGNETAENIIKKLKENRQSPYDQTIRYQEGKRFISSWEEVLVSEEEVKVPWKDQGVYLITGGAGGLGYLFAEEIAKKAKGVVLVLTGRSELSEEKAEQINALKSRGARAEYKAVDMNDKKAVVKLIQNIRKEFGELNGVIHSAGVIRDNFILNKTEEEFKEVLDPKVRGTVNLDAATRDMELDFFILFSSIAGGLGNVGQADYATANAFMNAYAEYRNQQVALKERFGQTLSVQWPLWREGGMGVDEATENLMRTTMGMVPLQTQNGIQALYQGLSSHEPQVLVVEGLLSRLKQRLLLNSQKQKAKAALATSSVIAVIDTDHLLDKIQGALLEAAASTLKLKLEDIDVDTELNEYGFDSITLTSFANQLNQTYQLELMPTIFFEHPTLNSFAKYLSEAYQDIFAEKFAVQQRLSSPLASLTEFKDAPLKLQRPRFMRAISGPAIQSHKIDPIAIVGMSGRFPMANDIEELWKNLEAGQDCITEIPKDRWDWKVLYGDPNQEVNKTNIKWGGFIEGVDEFDPLFFGISPREAELMDPQQRLLMQYAWLALEDAGYSAQSLSGSNTGIFIGTASSGYNDLISNARIAIEGYSATGMVPSVGPNRMSYFLNLHGPSEPVETACSSSLVAIHRAVACIGSGDCEQAIVGGINTIITPEAHISFNKAGMLCEDGRCKTFSKHANGYVRGEGVGILFLKKLSAAEAAGDHIYGVIRSTAENHGGRANSLTAPNPKAQADLLYHAYQKAGIDPRTVSYIEAHGTGTELGDPIEINGLKTAFRKLYEDSGDSHVKSAHCGLGSVKTNIGHLELAAGVVGVIKVLLQLKHKTLFKNLHCEEINPYIELKESPFYIVQETKGWEALQDAQGRPLPRRAGVSSFGFGGANAHVVIEEGPEYVLSSEQNKPCYLITLSAKHPDSLRQRIEDLHDYLKKHPESPLEAIAYTLNKGRSHFDYRCALVVSSVDELLEKLEQAQKGQKVNKYYEGNASQIPEDKAIYRKVLQSTLEELKLSNFNDAQNYSNNLEALASLYVKGYEIEWNLLHQREAHQKISLPTYPFLKKKCWVSTNNKLRAISHLNIDLIGSSKLHSPSDSNKSTFEGQTFKKTKQPYQDDASLHQATQNYLKEAFASITKIPYETINISQSLETYGIDSILFVIINQRLRKAIPNLSKTVLFEHKTIEDLADYLVCHHTNSLIQVLEIGNSSDNSTLENSLESNASDSLKLIQPPQQEDQEDQAKMLA